MEATSTRSDQGVSAARRAGVGVGIAVGCSGVAFGAAAVTAGLDVAQACVLSLFAFTGASQFALAGTVAGGGDLVAGTAGALLLGARNGLYGLRLAGPLGVRGLSRLATAHAVIDETTAAATAQLIDARADRTGRERTSNGGFGDPADRGDPADPGGREGPGGLAGPGTGPHDDRVDRAARETRPTREDQTGPGDPTGPANRADPDAQGAPGDRGGVAEHGGLGDRDDRADAERSEAGIRRARAGFYATFVSLYLAWNASTLIGAVGTSRVADPAVLGLDAVGPACFLALLWPRLAASGAGRLRLVAIGGAAIALLTTPLLPPGVPVLLASLAALPAILGPRLAPARRVAR